MAMAFIFMIILCFKNLIMTISKCEYARNLAFNYDLST